MERTIHFDRPDAPTRVLFVHHAGGSALSYLPLARALDESCDPHLLDLPGRGLRAEEPPVTDFPAAVACLLDEVDRLVDRPTVLVGNSLGALLVHALAAAAPPARQALVRAVVLSASWSPAATAARASHPPAAFTTRGLADLRTELRGYGGCPPELFDDPAMTARAATVLGHDLHLVDTYRAPASRLPAGTDYRVWYGVDDPHLPAEEAPRWGADLPAAPRVHGFPGGHFYLLTEPEPVAALRALVNADRATPTELGVS